jgi:serine/threonine protein kinase
MPTSGGSCYIVAIQAPVHRDVKPANIMLTHLDDDDEQRILLADFGIARNVDDISGLMATNIYNSRHRRLLCA